jgi:Uma2 family endonuclease
MIRPIQKQRSELKGAQRRVGPFTFEDFCALVPDGKKADLIDGVIYMASPENVDANKLFIWLITVINLYTRRKRLGEIFGSRVACHLDGGNGPEPDIIFVSAKHKSRIRRGGILGPPDLAIEIVSPESTERDYEKKRHQYERSKIPEYWIVDEEIKKVTLLRLDRLGKYRIATVRRGVLRSQVLKGFWLDPAWLWQDPRPDEMQIVQSLLAEAE